MRTSSLSITSVTVLSFLVLGCTAIDTTGISPESSKKPTGNPQSSIVVVEYGDLQCPACKGAHELITKPLLEKYADSIRFEFRHFPLRTIHPYAMQAAEASECAADQGKFWEYVNVNYEKQGDLSKNPFEDWAKQLNLDTDLFHRCVTSNIKEKAVLADAAMGEALQVNSTPSYFVNGTKVSNTMEAIESAIAAEKQKIESVPL